jgi:hypothetical protein
MSNEKLDIRNSVGAEVIRGGVNEETLKLKGRYTFECYGADGKLKWADTIENLVTTVGKNDLLDKYIAGTTYTAAWYLGLKGVGTADIADTAASHITWLEVGGANAPAYSQAARPTPTWSAAAAGAKATSTAVVFSITSSGTVAGAFLSTVATKDATTGILFSAGDFTGGSKTVANGDSINVSWSLSI